MKEVDTFSGLVFNELGIVPDDGEQNIELTFKGFSILINKIENHQITSAKITKLKTNNLQ